MKINFLHVFLALVVLLCQSYSNAFAQQSVNVRSGVHADYNRLVFDWPQKPSYAVSKNGDTITIDFKSAANFNAGAVDVAALPNVVALDLPAASGDNASVSIQIPLGSDYRAFAISSKVIVDVYNAPNAPKVANAVEKQPDPKPAQIKTEELAKEKSKEATAIESKVSEDMKAEQEAPVSDVAATDEEPEQKQGVSTTLLAPPDMNPHLIQMTSTRSFGLTVFQRGQWLWIIKDDTEIGVPPQIVGPDVEKLGEFDRFEIDGGIAYRLRLPLNTFVHARGGGLNWEIVLSPHSQTQNSVLLKREYDDSDPVRGGNLVWPVVQTNKILEFRDPEIGDTIYAVTTDLSNIRHYDRQSFVELETIPATVGLVVTSKVDDLELSKIDGKVIVSRTGGLVMAKPSDIKARELSHTFEEGENKQPQSDMKRIFSFDTWEMGGISALKTNQIVLMSGLKNKEEDDKITDLLTLAKLNLTNQRAHEALGFLSVVEDEKPELAKAPEFIALKAASNIMAGRPEEAIGDLNNDVFDQFGEIGYWRAYALSQVEDWQQAYNSLPSDFRLLETYPQPVRLPVTLALSEVALRGGDTQRAEELLGGIAEVVETAHPRFEAEWNYLRGELERQRGNTNGAAKYWDDLQKGTDDLHRVKAGLALTQLQQQNKAIDAKQAIDRLEGLRYAWRGDQLETLINYRLAMAYIDEKEYLKGLTLLRNAASITPGTKLAEMVTQKLTTIFRDLFANDIIRDIPAIDAITLYEEFSELTPPGEEGDEMSLKLADRMASAELLGRAEEILQNLVTRRLSGEKKIQAGLRLAGILLLDDKPEGTLRALDIVNNTLRTLPKEQDSEALQTKYKQEAALLKARAMAELDDTQTALESLGDLPPDRDVLRLKVDLAWRDGRWDDASNALQDLMFLENITGDKPLTPAHAELILNRAIALNLSGNRVGLANLRNRYGDVMKNTDQAKLFDVVSRERQSRLSGDREVLTNMIGEVDMFGEFLDIYKSGIDSDGEDSQ